MINNNLEEKSSESATGLKKSIIILVILCLVLIGTIMYLQYKNMTMVKQCNDFWKSQVAINCPTDNYNKWSLPLNSTATYPKGVWTVAKGVFYINNATVS